MILPQNIEGLTAIESGSKNTGMQGSKFALPPSFDASKYASKWVEQGPNVIEAQQPTVFVSAGVQAEGWQVFKQLKAGQTIPEPPKEGELPLADAKKPARPVMEPVTRVVGKMVFVLLFRPKRLQEVVNIIHANESREIVQREVGGQTNAANTTGDHGILTAADMAQFRRQFPDEVEPGNDYLKTTPLATRPAEAVELNLA